MKYFHCDIYEKYINEIKNFLSSSSVKLILQNKCNFYSYFLVNKMRKLFSLI